MEAKWAGLKKLSFETRVILRVGVVVALVVLVLLSLRLTSQQATMLADREHSILLQTQNFAREAERIFESAAATVRGMAMALDELRRAGRPDRKVANDIVRGGLVSNELLIGASTAWEPNAFDGRDADFINADPAHDETGRLIPWWYRNQGKVSVEKLIDYEKPGAGDWYLLPRQLKRQTVTEPYPYPVDGRDVLMTTISQPILEEGRFVGLTTVDIPLDILSTFVAKHKLYASGFLTLISDQGMVVAHPDPSMNGKSMTAAGFPDSIYQSVLKDAEGVYEIGDRVYAIEAFSIAQTGTQWAVVASVPLAEITAQVRRDAWIGALMGLLALMLVLGVMTWELRRSVLRPLGDDPHYVAHHVRRVADGDLTGADWRGHTQPPGSVVEAVRNMEINLARTIDIIRQGADQVATAAAEIAQGNHDLSARTESAAASLQQTAASVQHLSDAVQHSAKAASVANDLASQAAQTTERGGQAVQQVVATMSEIQGSAEKISDIIAVIDGIAFQTNILALNASVEAARAGEAGRGFAVVAGEVRQLAQRSAQAAREIKTLIETSVSKVNEGHRQVQSAGQTMQEIVDVIRRVADVIGEVTSAAKEQSESLQEVNAAVRQLDQTTQQNAALVEEMTAAAESLRQQASELQNAVSRFRLGSSA